MEVIVYSVHGAMKARYRGINYKTRLSKLNAAETDRVVLWDSASSNIMSRKEDIPSAGVYLHVDPPPESAATAEKYTIGTSPLPFGYTLSADMHATLQDGIRACSKMAYERGADPAIHGDAEQRVHPEVRGHSSLRRYSNMVIRLGTRTRRLLQERPNKGRCRLGTR